MTQEEKLWWSNFREANVRYFSKEIDSMNVQNDEYRMIAEIHARIKGHKVDYPCKCNPKRIRTMIEEINEKFDKL
jgi:hypothetical protein